MAAWIEERDEFPTLDIQRANFTTFVPLTMETSPSQIVFRIATAMFPRDNMVRFVPLDRVIRMQKTILTTVGGALGDSESLSSGNRHRFKTY